MTTPCTSVPRQTARVTQIERKMRQLSERDDRETGRETERAKDRKSERE
jgi:hypothetical protein